ncbi:unnamed protein product [Sphacelaria rigidula]
MGGKTTGPFSCLLLVLCATPAIGFFSIYDISSSTDIGLQRSDSRPSSGLPAAAVEGNEPPVGIAVGRRASLLHVAAPWCVILPSQMIR